MDHRLIEEQNIAEAYVAGHLPPDDEERFEEHLIECRECRERVAWAEDMRGSFQALGTEEAARTVQAAQAVQLGLLAWLARHRGAAGLAVAVLLLLLALPGWLLLDRQRLQGELAAARAAASRSTPPPPQPPPGNPSAPSAPSDTAERDRLAAQARDLEQQLAAARARGEELAGRLAALTRPQVNTAIFSLGVVRGEGDTNRVAVGREPAWIVLSIELPDAAAASYRATLEDAQGKTVWQGDGLQPTASDTLVLTLWSDLLAPGAYRLVLAKSAADPRPTAVPFEVVRRGDRP
jgi:hypothetical protein